jgi:hypothetical protein
MSSESESEVELLPRRRQRVVKERINFVFEPAQFRERFRLTMEQAEQLLLLVGPYLDCNTTRNKAMPADEKLLVALRFYASGDHYYTLGDCHGSLLSVLGDLRRLGEWIRAMFPFSYVCCPSMSQYSINRINAGRLNSTF